MNIGVITTSRADFGIYLPLLKKIKDSQHELFLFVGGMHTSADFGNSYQLIEKEGFQISEKLDGLLSGDSSSVIANSMANTLAAFAEIWPKYKNSLDVIFVLGDRFEMFAAASSILPFNIPIAHLHGGETTLGAIDNKFRHAITSLSDFHFVSHQNHAERVIQIINSNTHVYNVGALGVENLLSIEILDAEGFKSKFNFDISQKFVLTTIHPETASFGKNEYYINEFIAAVKEFDMPVLCTLPNADTEGNVIRKALLSFEREYPEKIKCFENLGIKGYLSAMKNCTVMIGNTSSGIIEAASFNKQVLNLGNRQEGRLAGENVIHVPFKKEEIIKAFSEAKKNKEVNVVNPYGAGNTAEKIMNIIENIFKK